jgi:hypothetical protein
MEDEEVELQAKILFSEDIPTGVRAAWTCSLPSVTKIRNYFGEKIAFYVHYLNFYTIMLLFPGIVGISCFVLQLLFNDNEDGDNDIYEITNTVFAIFVVVWAMLFYEFWRRQEVKYSIYWGQTNFEEDQVERVDFSGVIRRSPIDDNRDKYFQPFKRLLRIIFSTIVTLSLIGSVIATIYGLFELRLYLYKEWEGKWYHNWVTTIVSTINAIQITIFNYIYNFVALLLTRLENHKTETEFERSLISKTFIFQFVNSFNSLFYIAFLKQDSEG